MNEVVIQHIKPLVEKICNFFPINCIILFGSQARDNFTPHSDVDLLIVGDFKEKFIDRGNFIYENYDFEWGLDAFCYTPNEFENMFNKGTVSVLDAIDEGICLFGFDFFEKFKKKIEQLKERGLRKDPPVWILPESMIID